MNENTVYAGDNGRLICSKCAGYTAKTTGTDLSGMPLIPMTAADSAHWRQSGLGTMTCESGCTTA